MHHKLTIIKDEQLIKNQPQIVTNKEKQEPFSKRILIVDNEPDITLTFKSALEQEYNNNKKLEVHTFNDPLSVLSQFKPSFYDLLLIDINMPDMNGFELCTEILKIDVNVKIALCLQVK